MEKISNQKSNQKLNKKLNKKVNKSINNNANKNKQSRSKSKSTKVQNKKFNKSSKNKVLVVFYSLEGYTKKVAELIVKETNADVLELKLQKESVKKEDSKLSKYMWGGRQVMMKSKPALLQFDKNPSDYDLIFIGTPVWAFTFTPAIRTFLSEAKLKDKKIALFCTNEGSKGKTFENMEAELLGNIIVGKLDLRRPKNESDENKNKEEITAFTKTVANYSCG